MFYLKKKSIYNSTHSSFMTNKKHALSYCKLHHCRTHCINNNKMCCQVLTVTQFPESKGQELSLYVITRVEHIYFIALAIANKHY